MCLWSSTQKAPGHKAVTLTSVLPRKQMAQADMGSTMSLTLLLRSFFQEDLDFCKGVQMVGRSVRDPEGKGHGCPTKSSGTKGTEHACHVAPQQKMD